MLRLLFCLWTWKPLIKIVKVWVSNFKFFRLASTEPRIYRCFFRNCCLVRWLRPVRILGRGHRGRHVRPHLHGDQVHPPQVPDWRPPRRHLSPRGWRGLGYHHRPHSEEGRAQWGGPGLEPHRAGGDHLLDWHNLFRHLLLAFESQAVESRHRKRIQRYFLADDYDEP